MQYKYFKHNRCGKVSTAGEWNNETLKLCKDVQSKRIFKKIQHAIGQARWYVCPKCNGKAHMREIVVLMKSEVENERTTL